MRSPIRTSVALPAPAREALITLRIKRHRETGYRPTMAMILREGLWNLLVQEGIIDPLNTNLEEWNDDRFGKDRFRSRAEIRASASRRG